MMNRPMFSKQVIKKSDGGIASFIPRETKIGGQPHMLAYINPQEERLLQDYRGNAPTVPGPGNVPAYLFGFTSFSDMIDGGGAGGSGDSFYAGSHDDYVASGGTGAVGRG